MLVVDPVVVWPSGGCGCCCPASQERTRHILLPQEKIKSNFGRFLQTLDHFGTIERKRTFVFNMLTLVVSKEAGTPTYVFWSQKLLKPPGH